LRDEDAWRQLGSHDERAAQHAFDHLHKSYLSFGQRVVRRKFSDCQTEDIENAVQQAFLNLWQSRQRLQVADLPSWCGLLSKTACNCYFDILRARRPLLSLDDPHGIPWDEISSDEISFLLEILESLDRAATIGRLMEAADVCWLGLSPARPTEERTRRLLAAKLFYIEGAETEEILALLNRARVARRSGDAAAPGLQDALRLPGSVDSAPAGVGAGDAAIRTGRTAPRKGIRRDACGNPPGLDS
jgi:DNA-directed RNA polymerase specialized sigma24 family protein